MGTKQTNFQPDHSGKHAQVPITPGMTINHVSHGGGEHVTGHAGRDIARNGAPKHIRPVPVHGHMSKQTKSGALALGGDHASALEALSGQTVVPGIVKSTPGFGNGGIVGGSPLAKPSRGKNIAPVKPSFGMKSQTAAPGTDMHELGRAILDAAFSVGSPDDKTAHGRGRFPNAVEENT